MDITVKNFSTDEVIFTRDIIRSSFNENRVAIMLAGTEKVDVPLVSQSLYKIIVDDGINTTSSIAEFLSYNYIIMDNTHVNEAGETVAELAVGDNTLLFKVF